jgi:hypothetical protein
MTFELVLETASSGSRKILRIGAEDIGILDPCQQDVRMTRVSQSKSVFNPALRQQSGVFFAAPCFRNGLTVV